MDTRIQRPAAAAPVDVSPVRVAISYTTPEAGGFASLYVRGTDGQIHRRNFHLGSATPSGGWRALTGAVGSGPAAASDGGGTGVDVVAARSTRGTLVVRSVSWQDPGTWQDLGGVLTSAPSLAATTEGGPGQPATTVAAVARGTDGAAYLLLRRAGVWTRWQGLGGIFTSAPSVVVTDTATGLELRVFGRGGNGRVYSRRVQLSGTPITPWQMTGPLTTSAVAPEHVPGLFYAYAYRGARNELYWYGDGSSANIGGVGTSSPDVLETGQGYLIIVVRGTDNALWGNYLGGWHSLGGKLT